MLAGKMPTKNTKEFYDGYYR